MSRKNILFIVMDGRVVWVKNYPERTLTHD